MAKELDFLQREYGSQLLVDRAFLESSVDEAIERQPYTIMHLATHGQFKGNAEDSFLLTYDDKLNMTELRRLIGQGVFRDEPIELLTLSACQTAEGDDRAALGLAGVALRAGARSALATLWFINDQASAKLVLAFYPNLIRAKMSRATALQQAQLTLLKNERDRRYRHPYYWSAFLMLKTWL